MNVLYNKHISKRLNLDTWIWNQGAQSIFWISPGRASSSVVPAHERASKARTYLVLSRAVPGHAPLENLKLKIWSI